MYMSRFQRAFFVFLFRMDDCDHLKTSTDGGEARCFMDLIRNAVVAKLVLHCGLQVRSCCTEDRAHIVVLITCRVRDVLPSEVA